MNNFNKNLPYNPPVQPAAPKSDVSTYIIIAVVAFALGLGSGWLWAQRNLAPTSDLKNDETVGNAKREGNQSAIENLAGGNSVLVKDQPAGVEVAIEQVVLANAAWVVVREDDGKDAPGKILGAQLFDAGTGVGKVELLRGTEAGGTYYALIYSDNGDRAFDPKLDAPILDATNQPVMATFKAN